MNFVTRGMLKCATCGYTIVVEKHTKTYKNGKTQDFVYCHCSGKCKDFKCPQKKVLFLNKKFFDLAIEALAEEEDRKVMERDSRVEELNRQKIGIESELTGLRRMRYRGEISD